MERTADTTGGNQDRNAVYQVILSWESGNEEKGIPPDNPSREEMEESVDRVRENLGLADHQTWMVAHKDTGTPHVHVMINRVDPETGKMWSAGWDYPKVFNTIRELEKEHGWHEPTEETMRELWEERSQESLEIWEAAHEKYDREKSLRVWAQDTALEELSTSESWREFEAVVEEYGASLEARHEQGMVLKKDEKEVGLSSISRSIRRPKLEEKFGEEWEAYQKGVPSQDRALSDKEPFEDSGGREDMSYEEYGRDKSLKVWSRKQKLPELLKGASSWEHADRLLIGTDVTLRRVEERGLFMERDGQYVKMSTVDSELSQPALEERYGRDWEEKEWWSYAVANGHYGAERETRLTHNLQEAFHRHGGPKPSERQLTLYRKTLKLRAVQEAVENVKEKNHAGEQVAEEVQQVADEVRKALSEKEEDLRIQLVSDVKDLWEAEGKQKSEELIERVAGRKQEVLQKAETVASSPHEAARWVSGLDLSDEQRTVLREAGLTKTSWNSSQEPSDASSLPAEGSLSAEGSPSAEGPLSPERRAGIRQALTATSDREVEEIGEYLESRKKVAFGPSGRQEARREQEAIESEHTHVKDRPTGEKLSDSQTRALAEIYRLEETDDRSEAVNGADSGAAGTHRSEEEQEPHARWGARAAEEHLRSEQSKGEGEREEGLFSRLREALVKMDEEKIDELEEHLEGEARRQEVLQSQRGPARTVRRQRELAEEADEVASEKIAQVKEHLEDDRRIRAAEVFEEVADRFDQIREEAPDEEEIERIASRHQEDLSDEELAELGKGDLELEIQRDRRERGDLEAYEALSSKEQAAVKACEVAARAEGVRQEDLQQVAAYLGPLSEGQRREARQVLGEEAQEVFSEARSIAKSLEQEKGSDQDISPGQGGEEHSQDGFGPSL